MEMQIPAHILNRGAEAIIILYYNIMTNSVHTDSVHGNVHTKIIIICKPRGSLVIFYFTNVCTTPNVYNTPLVPISFFFCFSRFKPKKTVVHRTRSTLVDGEAVLCRKRLWRSVQTSRRRSRYFIRKRFQTRTRSTFCDIQRRQALVRHLHARS